MRIEHEEEPQAHGRALQGDGTGRVAVIRDVTDRTKLEQEQALSLRLLDTLLTSAPFGFAFFDRDLRFVRINEQLAEINGYSVAAHLGKTVAEILPTLAGGLHEVAARILATGQPVLDLEFTGEAARAPGIVRHCTASWHPVRGERGEIIGFNAVVVDITDRKQAEAALRETELHFRALAEASAEIPYRMSADWSTMMVLDGRGVLESSVSPREGWAWVDQYIPLDEQARVKQAISDAIAKKGLFELEHRVLRADGSTGWTFSRAVPLLDENQGLVAWFGAASDITGRKQAEDRLRASEARLRRVFESNVVGMIRWDLDRSLILDANAEFLRMTGYVRDDITSGRLNFRDLTPPEWTARNEEAIRAIRAYGHEPPYEKEYFHKDGSRLPLLIAGTRFEHSPSEGMSFLIDLTEMKQAQAMLRERTELLNGVLEGTTDVIFVKDLNGRLLLANAAFAAAARSTPEQLVGKTDEYWFPPDVAAAVRQQDEAVIAGGTPIQTEESIPVAGEARVFLTQKAPLRDGNNRVVGILGISRDITERKRIELNLIETTAMAKKANLAKSDFLSGMSHELRTPLNAILGFAQLMESSTPPPTPAQSRGLEQIVKAGWYLLELVNELLDLAQVESGKMSLTQEPVSLAQVMLECQAMIEPQARERGISMKFPSFELPGYVRADRTRVKQVLINLLSNAIKYNKAQGAVTVEVSLSSPDAVRVSVRDTGEGLAPEQLAQLFQPFNRLGRQAGAEQGTGIGLVMSRRIVELMGGAIGAESTVGVGSVFWFELKWVSA